ncbi:Hypothetical protein CINCED_3A012407 [Cinara cedri]|uniref:Uncharacterized protein n=1 Tax=Cinara cedri TaxID=506608 RepID=A0A5E4M5Y3_9HEMI|nr:Hypothetical protein CINCED_3A012407 [Cinara cedri]
MSVETGAGMANEDKEFGQLDQNKSFKPVLYSFRVPPQNRDSSKFALQLPFATLFDNLIAVLWSVYGKDPTIRSGINQVQWALEYMKCMKLDYSYPESIRSIIYVLEKQLMELYAQVGEKLYQSKKQELDKNTKDENEHTSQNLEEKKAAIPCVSFNEKDIMDKLKNMNLSIDPKTGEAKNIKELNSLGRRKTIVGDEKCKIAPKSSETYLIGKLQKILSNTMEEETKTNVEEIIKNLKVQKPGLPDGAKSVTAS